MRASAILLSFLLAAASPASGQTVSSLTDGEVASYVVNLAHGLDPMSGPDAQALVDRIRTDPLTYVPLLSPYASVDFIRANQDRPLALKRTANAISLLLVACGPAGADEAEARVLALIAERDSLQLSVNALVGSLDATSTTYERQAARSADDQLAALVLVEKGMMGAFTGARDARLRDVVLSRLTTSPDLAWAYVDYLDVVAPDDAAVSEAMHQLYETTDSPSLRARLEPRVTAYLESLTPPRYGDHGFVWADQASASSYSPSPYYRKNSSGGDITITRYGVGYYYVRFHGLGGSGGNVQVTSYGYDNRYCKVGGWGGSPDLGITVYCYDASGARADSRYTVLFYREALDHSPDDAGSTAYLWAQSPTTTGTYDASPYYSYNDTSGTNTITRVGTGQYDVHLPGIGYTGGPQVTAYGSDSVRCRPSSWWSASGGTTLRVACYAPSGTAADSRFTLSYSVGRVPGLRPDGTSNRGAYAWANNPTTASYTASTTYQANSLSSAATPYVTVRRTGTGSYEVDIPRDVPIGAADTVQIGAYGGSGAHCKAAWWSRASTYTRVAVRCYAASGALVDNRFDVLYVTDADG